MKKVSHVFRSILAVLALFPLLAWQSACADDPPTGDQVTVVVDSSPLKVPRGFQRQLRNRGFSRMAFADSANKLHLFELNGQPVNLCGSAGVHECVIHTDAASLVMLFSTLSPCGTCSDGGALQNCRKAAGQDYWPCVNTQYNAAHACDNNCGP